MYITQLTDLNDEKEENKIILQEQIEELKLRRDNRQNEKQNFGDDKKANIESIWNKNEMDIKNKIEGNDNLYDVKKMI